MDHDLLQHPLVCLSALAAFLARLGFVFFEIVAAKVGAERKACNVTRLDLSFRRLDENVRGRRFLTAQKPAHAAAEIEPVLAAIGARFSRAAENDLRTFQTLRREKFDGLLLLALEAGDICRFG